MAIFKELNLNEKLKENLSKNKFNVLTEIQYKTIPLLLKNKSLVVKSETGSGKSLCFVVPILDNVDIDLQNLQYIVIAPTRELCKQLYDLFMLLSKNYKNINIKLLSSDKDINRSISELKNNPQIIIATIGRLDKFFVKNSYISISNVKGIVIDEADMLFDDGFSSLVDSFLSKFNENVQKAIFSASFSENMLSIFKKYILGDEIINIDSDVIGKNVENIAINIKHKEINEAVFKFIKATYPYFLIIFCSEKKDIFPLYNFLAENNYKVTYLHGGLESNERKATIRKIKKDEYQIVICSDLLSRGIDLPFTDTVLSINLPNNIEYYLHRAGRTGRFDKKGCSYVFYDEDDTEKLEKLLSMNIKFKFKKFDQNDNLVDTQYKKEFVKKRVVNDNLERKAGKIKSKYTRKGVKPNYKKKMKQKIKKEAAYMRRRNK